MWCAYRVVADFRVLLSKWGIGGPLSYMEEQGMLLEHGLQYSMSSLGTKQWTCKCRLVAAFRTWLSDRGAGGPVPIVENTPLLPEHELLNHYEQHVRHCPSCSLV